MWKFIVVYVILKFTPSSKPHCEIKMDNGAVFYCSLGTYDSKLDTINSTFYDRAKAFLYYDSLSRIKFDPNDSMVGLSYMTGCNIYFTRIDSLFDCGISEFIGYQNGINLPFRFGGGSPSGHKNFIISGTEK